MRIKFGYSCVIAALVGLNACGPRVSVGDLGSGDAGDAGATSPPAGPVGGGGLDSGKGGAPSSSAGLRGSEASSDGDSVTDEIGLGSGLERDSYDKVGATLVDVIDVETPRVVTQIEAHLVMDQASELGWLIFELDGGTSTLRAEAWTQPEAAGDAYY